MRIRKLNEFDVEVGRARETLRVIMFFKEWEGFAQMVRCFADLPHTSKVPGMNEESRTHSETNVCVQQPNDRSTFS